MIPRIINLGQRSWNPWDSFETFKAGEDTCMDAFKKKINGFEDHYILYIYDADDRMYSAYIGKNNEDLLILLDRSGDDRFQVMEDFVAYVDGRIADGSVVSTYDKLAETVVKCTNDKLREFNRDIEQLDKKYNDSKAELEKQAQKPGKDMADAVDITGIQEIDINSPLGKHIMEALRDRLSAMPAPQPVPAMFPHGRAFQMRANVDKDGRVSFGPEDVSNMMTEILSNIIVSEVKSGRKLSEALADVDNIVNTVSANAAKLTLRFKS
jgi:hypothetical protein